MNLFQRPPIFVPNGVPISRGFYVPDTNAFEIVHQALEILDQFHGDGLLSRVPILFDSALGNKAELQLNLENFPEFVRLGTQSQSYFIDVWHEIAHILDLMSLGTSGIFASDSGHLSLNQWWDAIISSKAYQDLLDLRGSKVILTKSGLKPVLRSQVEYLLAPRECFARSYQQYIAISAGVALEFLNLGIDNPSKPRQIVYSTQWAASDFEPIALAFDRLFVIQGWVK